MCCARVRYLLTASSGPARVGRKGTWALGLCLQGYKQRKTGECWPTSGSLLFPLWGSRGLCGKKQTGAVGRSLEITPRAAMPISMGRAEKQSSHVLPDEAGLSTRTRVHKRMIEVPELPLLPSPPPPILFSLMLYGDCNRNVSRCSGKPSLGQVTEVILLVEGEALCECRLEPSSTTHTGQWIGVDTQS